jgi:hypothetical protein
VLVHHRNTLDQMAQELVEKETLDAMDLTEILGPLPSWPGPAGRSPRPGRVGAGRGGGRLPIPVDGPGRADEPSGSAEPPVTRPIRPRPVVAPGRAVPVGRTRSGVQPGGALPPVPGRPGRADPARGTAAGGTPARRGSGSAPDPVAARRVAAPPVVKAKPARGAGQPVAAPRSRSVSGAGAKGVNLAGVKRGSGAGAKGVTAATGRTVSARGAKAVPEAGAKGVSNGGPKPVAAVPAVRRGRSAGPAVTVTAEDLPVSPRRGRARPNVSEP